MSNINAILNHKTATFMNYLTDAQLNDVLLAASAAGDDAACDLIMMEQGSRRRSFLAALPNTDLDVLVSLLNDPNTPKWKAADIRFHIEHDRELILLSA